MIQLRSRDPLSIPHALDNTPRDGGKAPGQAVACFRCGETVPAAMGVQYNVSGRVIRQTGETGPTQTLSAIMHARCA